MVVDGGLKKAKKDSSDYTEHDLSVYGFFLQKK